jgi:AcrR family transcriptional regulator
MIDQAASPSDPPRRKRRLTVDEVRERMLTAAQDIVATSGMTVSLEGVTLEQVMREADVPRSSVYNLWPTRAEFVDALLVHLARPAWMEPAAFGQRASADVALQVIKDNRHRLGTPEGRLAVQREAVRQSAARNYDDLVAAKGWRFYFALASTVGSVQDPEARAAIAAALHRTETDRIAGLAAFYQRLITLVGLRPRAGYTYEHLALAGGALMQGMMLRKAVSENRSAEESAEDADRDRTIDTLIDKAVPGPDGADWSFISAAYYGIFEYLTEPDPDWIPPSD